MPDTAKIRRGETKHVLREAAKGLVPDFVLAKRKLGFFAASTGHWLGASDGAIVEAALAGLGGYDVPVEALPVLPAGSVCHAEVIMGGANR